MDEVHEAGTLTELDLGEPDDLRVSVAVTPSLTVIALLVEIVGGRRRGLPPEWRTAISTAIRPRSRSALAAFAAPGHSMMPDCLGPSLPVTADGIEPELQRLCEVTDDDFLADLERLYGPEPMPAHWRQIARDPGHWLGEYVDALADIWEAVRDVWRRGAPLLEREVERLGRAVVTRSLPVLLGALSPPTRYLDGSLRLPDYEPVKAGLAGRRLVLVPTLAGPRSIVCNLDLPDVVWLGYPLEGATALWSGTARPRARRTDALEVLCGDVRAAILRALDRRTTMGRLAHVVGTSPNALSYHARCLEDAGLVLRQREGREVGVERTERGDRLLDLLTR
ncbi:hypothetical protein SUDANB95_01884 [Actinosynnema sp. ALI-1.44]